MNNELMATVERLVWRFAKTTPKNPHWYVVHKFGNDALFKEVNTLFLTEGYDMPYFGRTWRVYNYGEYRYWFAGSPEDSLLILNRTKRVSVP